MVRTCEDCGKVYDDLDHLTICPHEWFPPGPGVPQMIGTQNSSVVDALKAALEKIRDFSNIIGDSVVADTYIEIIKDIHKIADDALVGS